MHTRIASALKSLEIAPGPLYRAAQPGYPSNFSRDSFIYALLATDRNALSAQIEFSAQHQGRRPNPITGEEPGKIHHELPGVEFGRYYTTYNACDTTALFLNAVSQAVALGQPAILKRHQSAVELAVKYVQSHTTNNLFYEDPSRANSGRFALNVTYWKDSFLNAGDPLPHYPICYSLVHFQTAHSLEAIGRAAGRTDWTELGRAMAAAGMKKLWHTDHFITALDGRGNAIDALSSDSLHALLYLDPSLVGPHKASQVARYSRPLVTAAGYLTAVASQSDAYEYHTRYVWVFEQALLHSGATKHGLTEVQDVSARVARHLDNGFPELLDPQSNFAPAGNPLQLWSVGAYRYFRNTSPHGRNLPLPLP